MTMEGGALWVPEVAGITSGRLAEPSETSVWWWLPHPPRLSTMRTRGIFL